MIDVDQKLLITQRTHGNKVFKGIKLKKVGIKSTIEKTLKHTEWNLF